MIARKNIRNSNKSRKNSRFASSQRLLAENLEPRILLTTLYWAASAPTNVVGTVDLMAANWTTDPTGHGQTQPWTPGAEVVFPDVTLSGGYFAVSADFALHMSGNLTLDHARLLINQGTLNWDGGNLTLTNGAAVEIDGTLNWNSGHLTVAAGDGVHTGYSCLTNRNTLNWNGGELTDAGGMANSGLINWNAGHVAIESGATESGWMSNLAGTMNWNGGNLTVNGTLYLFDGGRVNWNAGNLTVNNTLDNYATVNFNGGQLEVNGQMYSYAGTLNFNGGQALINGLLYGESTINGNGTDMAVNGEFYSDTLLNWNAGQLTVNSGGVLDNVSWGGIDDGGVAYSFPGIMNLNGGMVTIADGGTLHNSSFLDAGRTYTQPGTIHINGGQLVVNGTAENLDQSPQNDNVTVEIVQVPSNGTTTALITLDVQATSTDANPADPTALGTDLLVPFDSQGLLSA